MKPTAFSSALCPSAVGTPKGRIALIAVPYFGITFRAFLPEPLVVESAQFSFNSTSWVIFAVSLTKRLKFRLETRSMAWRAPFRQTCKRSLDPRARIEVQCAPCNGSDRRMR